MYTSWLSSSYLPTNPESQIRTKEALLAPELYRIDENLDIIFNYFESREVSSTADQRNLYDLMINKVSPEECVGHFTLRKCKEKGIGPNHKPGVSEACPECVIPYEVYHERDIDSHYDKFLKICELCSSLFLKLFKKEIKASDFVDIVFQGVDNINKEIEDLRKGTWGMAYAVSSLTSYWNGSTYDYGEGIDKEVMDCKKKILFRVNALRLKVLEKSQLSDT